jgi:hypothetical protein
VSFPLNSFILTLVDLEDENSQQGCYCVLNNIFKILQQTLPLSLNPTLEVLTAIAIHCKQHCSLFAIEVSQWLLSVLENNQMQHIPKNKLTTSYFHVLGLYIRSIPAGVVISDVQVKHNCICSLVTYALSPLQATTRSWRSEDQISDRVNFCVSQRFEIMLSVTRLSGIIKSMSGDDLFTNFFETIHSTLFDVLTCVTESYVWLNGRLNNLNISGVDAFISTSLCHIGESLNGTVDSKRISYLSDLHDTLVTCLIKLFDLNGSSQEYSQERIRESLIATKRILDQVQSSRLIDFVAIMIRWSTVDGNEIFESPEEDLPTMKYQLVRHCLVFSAAKLSDPLLHERRSLAWLSAEIDSCLRLCRQVALSSFPLLIDPIVFEERRAEVEEQYSKSISFELFNMINLLISSWELQLDVRFELFVQPRSISSILQHFVHHRNFLIGNTSCQHHLADLTANIFMGLCYGTLASKLRAWSEIVHTLLSLVLFQTQEGNSNGEQQQLMFAQQLSQLIRFIGERVFMSKFALSNWMTALERQGSHPLGQIHGVVCHGSDGERLYLTQEAAQDQFMGAFISPSSPHPMYRIENKKSTVAICQKIVNKFRIDFSEGQY